MTGTPTESDEAENERHREKARKHKAARDKIMATKIGEKGLLIVNTGTGKGKTSAALGMVFRHIGHGYPVAVVQFTKSPAWDTGEAKLLAKFPELVTLHIMGEGFTWETQDRERDIAAATKGWERAKELIRDDRHRMVLLDELNIVLRYDYLDLNEVLTFLREEKPADKHVVITGRNAKPELIEMADLVTEMTLVKHPFRAGRERPEGHRILMERPTPALMIQATGSNAGKSTIVAGLARALVRRGLKVAPFKPQNMSNNAAVADRGRRDRPRPGRAGAGGAGAAERAHEPGAAEAGDRYRRANHRAGQTLGYAAREELSGKEGGAAAGGAGEFCLSRARCRYHPGRRRRQPGGDQPARRRHRQHGICRGSQRARGDARGHRSRRRYRQPCRHASRSGAGRDWRGSTASSSTSFAAMLDCSSRA